jgi:hypothetical protein
MILQHVFALFEFFGGRDTGVVPFGFGAFIKDEEGKQTDHHYCHCDKIPPHGVSPIL